MCQNEREPCSHALQPFSFLFSHDHTHSVFTHVMLTSSDKISTRARALSRSRSPNHATNARTAQDQSALRNDAFGAAWCRAAYDRDVQR